MVFFKLTALNVLWLILKKPDAQFIYYYMLVFELIDTVCGIILCFLSLFECGYLCSVSYNYLTKLLELIFYTYGTNMILQFETFLEISLAYERLKIFSSKQLNYKVSRFKTKMVVFLVLANVFSLPNYLITRSITPIGILVVENSEKVLYKLTTSSFAQNNHYWETGLFVFDLFRGLFFYILLLIINIRIIYKFRAVKANKLRVIEQARTQPEIPMTSVLNTHQEVIIKKPTRANPTGQAKTNLTRTVLAMNFNFLLCNLPISLAPILFRLMGQTPFYSYYIIIVNVNGLLTHMLYLPLYFLCNPIFRKAFLEIYSG